jgi:WD40 repeat protein
LLVGHSGDVTALAMDPTSPSFATAGDDKTLRVTPIYAPAIDISGTDFVCHLWLLQVWCARRHALLGVAELPGSAGRSVAISPQGNSIAVGLANGSFAIYDPDSLELVRNSLLPPARSASLSLCLSNLCLSNHCSACAACYANAATVGCDHR